MDESIDNVLISLKEFLRDVSSNLLDVEATDVEAFLNKTDSENFLMKFLNRSDTMALYAETIRNGSCVEFRVGVGMGPPDHIITTVAFVRTSGASIDPSAKLCSQITVMSLPGGTEEARHSFLGTLQQHTRYTITPLVRLASKITHSESDVANIANVQRKLRELELSIDQCQQCALVPEIKISVPPSLVTIASKISALDAKRFLDKYIPAQVDAFFEDIGITELMGSNETQKEDFANDVNKFAKLWPLEIGKQTKLLNSPFPMSASKEVEFWRDFESKLSDSKHQMESPEVLLTKLVLKRTNRVSEELIKEAENDLDRSIEIVRGSHGFVRDYPVESVLTAGNIFPALSSAATNCLHHFTKLKYGGSLYDLHRAGGLLDVLSSEVHTRLEILLRDRSVMTCSMQQYQSIVDDCNNFFRVWDTEFLVARNVLTDMEKRRSIKLKYKTVPGHKKLEERIFAISEFREQHEKLSAVLFDILIDQDDLVLKELKDTYRLVLPDALDCVDTSEDGDAKWCEALNLYEKKIEKLEDSISRLLCEQLKNSKTTDETFRLFSLFNPLFFRRQIWNAVSSFRIALIKNVHEDIERLQIKFKQRYDESLERTTADLRDIPPLSGRILWARQIENQLKVLLVRMENVLGPGWQDQSEGKKLKDVCDELLSFLDIDSMIENWTSVVSTFVRDVGNSSTVVFIVKANGINKRDEVAVNYDPRLVQLFKEVRYLEWLLPSNPMPYSIKKPADDAQVRYPAAAALQAAMSVYYQAKNALSKDTVMLVVSHDQAVRDLVQDAIMGSRVVGSKQYQKRMNWGGEGLSEWVEKFSRRVNRFEEKVEDACLKTKQVHELIRQLRVCNYDSESMEDVISSIQNIVDDMQMRGFSNIEVWVNVIDSSIEEIIAERLKHGIQIWVDSFSNGGSGNSKLNEGYYELNLGQTVHEILLSNQILYVSPSLEIARSEWIIKFHEHLSVCCALPRITASRFDVFGGSSVAVQDYSSALNSVGVDAIRAPYLAIEKMINSAKKYAQQWLQYQALWDVPVNAIADRVDKSISEWQELLQGIKLSRATIESIEDEKCFGPIVINFKQVQTKVNMKYDTWQRELQNIFGTIISERCKEVHSDFLAAKRHLEAVQLDSSTREVIAGVEYIIQLRNSIDDKKQQMSELESSERLLVKQRYQFPKDWLSFSNVISTFNDVVQILERRVSSMDSQFTDLQNKILEEDSSLTKRIEELVHAWEKERPSSGSMSPSDALQILSMFNSQVAKVKEDYNRTSSAKQALGLEVNIDGRPQIILDEISDFRDVWTAVAPVQDQFADVRRLSIRDIGVPQLRKKIDALISDLNLLPVKVRSYSCFEMLQTELTTCLAMQPVIRDLLSEALKERHWKLLLKTLGIDVMSSIELQLGHLWGCGLLAHKKKVSEVLSTAQGELALEKYIKDVKDYWSNMHLNVVTRDGGIRLITDWTELFTVLDDHLNALSSLKQSPYFRNVAEFQDDANAWETKLTLLRSIFDAWVEVQRKWVYLHGIFQNADIKAQLPSQFTKFKGVDNEFSRLMKRVSLKPQVQEILGVDGILGQLERQDSTMTVIQKALGEYLEKQRQVFPRFYFVNNDDLVEIIGNSTEPAKVLPHLSKMFSAISSVGIVAGVNDSSHATSLISKEGECMNVTNEIDLSSDVKEWLGKLESEMRSTLAGLLDTAIESLSFGNELTVWLNKFPAQIVILATQIDWCACMEKAMASNSENFNVKNVLTSLQSKLQLLSGIVLDDVEIPLRKKCEQLITEIVHQRDVSRQISSKSLSDKDDFSWLYHLRFYWNAKDKDIMQRLLIRISNATFFYGFEYLGIGERLVQTSLTDRCYLTLTQALHLRMGGNPFGPAGTGKTESVKMLGCQLGRFVLVFNCDESFDYGAMGRIFAGLCQVGSWGCFDEFNRLEERILSAVSQQILAIQQGLMAHREQIELLGFPCRLHDNVGIFVTMNPGYAGRSNLPDNLKQLFRAVAMVVPDKQMIAQVMLFSQGIHSAEELAGKIVLLFNMCEEQLSVQGHYDFGLRSLKSVLTGAGDLKRNANKDKGDMSEIERNILIRSTCNSIVPKLVAEDIPVFSSIIQAIFPGCDLPKITEQALIGAVREVCSEESLEFCESWVEKILQIKHVTDLRHGVMLVGPSCTGKTYAWRTLLKALSKVDGAKSEFFVIDPKAVTKDKLFGSLDPNTLEWTDGIFTKLLRKISDPSNFRSGSSKRSWIIFDGDVDPEWAENLNSVLDDNKVLTLPSGDRLKLPPNIRIIMEVDTLKHATLATVSRCGMVWFADSTISLDTLFRHQLSALQGNIGGILSNKDNISTAEKDYRAKFVEYLSPFYSTGGLVELALNYSLSQAHVMFTTCGRLLIGLHSLLLRGLSLITEYNDYNSDLPMSDSHLEKFTLKYFLFSVLWGFGASLPWGNRQELAEMLLSISNISLPDTGESLVDYTVETSSGEWVPWKLMVPQVEIEAHKVASTDVVVTTADTLRHIEVLKGWLDSHKPLILCGPPGSGKTMTLSSVIDGMSDLVLASLNFSSGTTPDLILKTFNQYCEVIDSPEGLIMQPNRQSYSEDKWLVVFCDEINLPQPDKYGTQRVIMFMRQLTEQGGFWNKDCKWVNLRRIQFVGACNPPTDAGRVELSERFMRHTPLLLVDYPGQTSLKQIYRCFNHALLKLHPNLRGSVDSLTDAMVAFYSENKSKFTPDIAPQYVYSPRELSRWVRAMYEAMEPMEAMTLEELVRLWAHEGLRLFHDRLVTSEEKEWCNSRIDAVANQFFPGAELSACLQRPLLYSNWLSKTYESVDQNRLRDFVAARLKVFYEEELDVPLVIFDDVLEHVLRIDNVLRHPMGHMLLVGESGVGKTVLSRFVSWMNGLSIFQIKASSRYTLDNFDEDLRSLLRRVGLEGEKICFIFDESNVLSSAFLERMNALLASGEVPGLFEGEELSHLMSACQNNIIQQEGSLSETEDEVWRRFTKSVQRNLHVVFTMNPDSTDFNNRCTTSPALFNRCVVNWCGTWTQHTLLQVGHEFTNLLDTGYITYNAPAHIDDILAMVCESVSSLSLGLHEAVSAALVSMHGIVKDQTFKLGKSSGRQHYLSPRDFLDLIRNFVNLEQEKKAALQDQQTHIRTGLDKLLETQLQVASLRKEMVEKETVLRTKDEEANLKLSQMVEKQNEAEHQKVMAEELTTQLSEQNEEIKVRKETVETELAEAEPALIAAKESVQNIRKAQLDEVRALGRPPMAVQLTMEMVCVMIGETSTDWTEIRKVIRRDDFIATVVNFNPMTLTPKLVKKAQEYLNNPELDAASVERASRACGPLYTWAQSQISYSTILRKIKPLRDEVAALEEKSATLSLQQADAVAQVSSLEASIVTYKAEYASAIRDTETIRSEMGVVTKKVSRAESLLSSLDEEKERWGLTSTSFDMQMSTLIGDSLITAAFLTYSGIFDHKCRQLILERWSETLESKNISFRPDIDMSNYLSSPSEQLLWKSYGLPSDNIAIQNCIILERCHRFPMVIDPSGQAINFLIQKYSHRKIIKTSFLDSSFMKTLATCVRFGTPLLVQDVETLDPVLNPLLNREFQKTGGRTLIRIGSEEIDYSPQFMIILATRNPFAHFAPDLCSRVTMVNFTVTPASLEAQALSRILQSERPDVDRRRVEIQRIQSEQRVKVRELEEELLNKISAVQGAILDDDTLVKSLEVIKAEATDINREALLTAQIMDELKTTSNLYEPLATAMTSVYFSLERLADVSYLYQFSLHFFLQIVEGVLILSGENESHKADPKLRVEVIAMMFYKSICKKVLCGLKFEDKLLFVTRLAQIRTSGQPEKGLTDVESDFLLRGFVTVVPDKHAIKKWKETTAGELLSDAQIQQIASLTQLPSFSGLLSSFCNDVNKEIWSNFFLIGDPENRIPKDWITDSSSQERSNLLSLMVIRILRPDRVLAAVENYVSSVMGEEFLWREYAKLNLRDMIERDSTSAVPIMLCSESGQDLSSRIDTLAASLNKTLFQVAMGSPEGYIDADKKLAHSSKIGGWVLLRNVHLCPEWLTTLEKRLHNYTSHENFRLFLTCEVTMNLPTSLLRASDVVLVEAPTGVKSALQKFFVTTEGLCGDPKPVERSRLFALLAWFNAIVQERLRYVPFGWTKHYEFSEADTRCAVHCINQWVDSVAGSRGNISPEQLPWKALRTTLSESVYGGRVDNIFDQKILDSFIESVFKPENYGASSVLCYDFSSDCELVTMPNSVGLDAFESWVNDLPEVNSPTWLGLPASTENQLQSQTGQRIIARIAFLQGTLDDLGKNSGDGDHKSQLLSLQKTISSWLMNLPKDLDIVIENETKTSLDRCLLSEVNRGLKVLSYVRGDLNQVMLYCQGNLKLTNHIGDLLGCLMKGSIPVHWTTFYTTSPNLSVGAWISDLAARCTTMKRHCTSLTNPSPSAPASYWLGGMFSPEAFITATRQHTAQTNSWSLEDLELYLDIGIDALDGAYDTVLEKLVLEGAEWGSSQILTISSALQCQLPKSRIRWRKRSERGDENYGVFPMYLNSSRASVVVEALVVIPREIPASVWAQRGVAFVMQTSSIH